MLNTLLRRHLLVLGGLIFLTAPVGWAQDVSKILRLPQMSAIPSLDPGLAQDSSSIEVIEQLFLGLTDYDPKTYEVLPELATDWSASADSRTYTFRMRQDVKWSNGDPVTAQDIEYAIRRNVAPDTASPYAYVLYILEGAEALNQGKSTDFSTLGVRAVDDYTVEFRLTQPAGFFPAMAGLWTYRPLPRKAIEAHGTAWTEPQNIVTNGSYQLKAWDKGNQLILARNPAYRDAVTKQGAQIEEVHYYITPESSTGLAMFENGELDVMGGTFLSIPSAEIDRIKREYPDQFSVQPDLCTYYLGVNNEREPTNNPLVRKALSAAIDRKTLVERVTRGGQEPATTFTRPPIFGSVDPKEGVGIGYNPEQARRWLAEAGYPDGKGFPTIIYMHNTSENHAKVAQAVQAMLKRNLGIEVRVENQEWKVYLKSTAQPDAPHLFRFGWCADYPDANNWLLEVFHPTKSLNRIRWQNAEYAELTEKAMGSTNPSERLKLYRRAEQILNEEQAAIIPLYFYTANYLVHPRVKNWFHMALGGQQIRNWRLEGSP
jgi:oligopeptide transport system substrate-binding protein